MYNATLLTVELNQDYLESLKKEKGSDEFDDE